jgi:hypothetical protein
MQQPFELPPVEPITDLPNKTTTYVPPQRRKTLSPASAPYVPTKNINPEYKLPSTSVKKTYKSPVESPRYNLPSTPVSPYYQKTRGKNSLPLIGLDYKYMPVRGVAYVKRDDKYKNIPTKDKRQPRVNEWTWFENEDTQIKWYTDPKFRDIKNLLTYEIVNINYINDKNNIVKRSSYIPYIVNKGERYWLLGSFYDFPQIKVDFGGKCNTRRRETGYECATRETNEETSDVLTDYILPQINNIDLVRVYRGYNRSSPADGSNLFIMIDMTNNIDSLDVINNKIDLAWTEKPDPKSETFGPLGFYSELDILTGKILTSFALTDFINNFKKWN